MTIPHNRLARLFGLNGRPLLHSVGQTFAQLEDRALPSTTLLSSGDPLCTPQVYDDCPAVIRTADGQPITSWLDGVSLSTQGAAAPSPAREIVFVDSRINEMPTLLDDLRKQGDTTRTLEVVVLDAQRDGLDQITEQLAGRSDIAAVHIVAHGAEGMLVLGNRVLDASALTASADRLSGWANALTADADILLYGCDIGAGESGRALVQTLAQLTAADVAASDDLTGQAALKGDWDLENQTGTIEARVAFSEAVQRDWGHVLTVAVDAASSDSTNGQNSLTIPHMTSGTNRLMLVSVAIDPHGERASSVRYNGVNLTFVGAREMAGSHSRIELWSLVAPTTGLNNVVVNLTGTSYHGVVVGVMTFTGVDQTAPIANFRTTAGNSSFASATLSSTTGNLVFAAVHSHNGSSAAPGGGQTEYFDEFNDNSNSSGTVKAGASSVTSSWTVNNDDWSVAAVSIQADVGSPIITGLAEDNLRYTAGGGPIVIDQGGNATVTDADSPNFNTGTLTVSFESGSDAGEDVLGIRNQGTGAGQIGVSGSNITYGGTTIGTFTGGSGGTNLVVTLNSNANTTNTAALIRNITFRDTDASSPTTGTRTVRFVLTDGDGGTSESNDTTVTLGPVSNSPALWLSTVSSASSSSGFSWTDGEVVRFGDPNLAFEPGTTAGTFSRDLDLDTFAADGNTDVHGLYKVRSTVTVGSGANSVTLQAGDVLFSTTNNDTFGGIAGTTQDLWRFHPTTPGDYTSGTFSILLNSPTGDSIRDISLVESTITVGGVTLNAGDFLLVLSSAPYDTDVWRFAATGVGNGTTSGTFTQFIDGSDIGIGQQIGAMEFINQTVTLGGTMLQAGQFVMSVLNDGAVGDNNLPVKKFDLFVLDVTQAGSFTSATASLLLEGSDVGMTAGGEEWDVVALTDVNQAPVLSGANNLTTILEDPSNNPGTLVSTLVSGKITDADTGAMTGIAVTAVDNTNGTWQWSANGGVDWNNFGSPSTASARLLIVDSNTYVRFVPNANFNGTVSNGITFRAWDQTTGTAGLTADTTTNGSSTAFSTATASSSITVTAVNDAPVLSGANNFTTITEDQTGNSGDLVSTLISGQVSEVDAGAVQGIAVTGLNSGTGAWQYSLDGGATWGAVGAVSSTSALLLRSSDRLRFVPDGQNGTTASVTFRAWDQSSGSAGTKVDASSNGGTTAFSTATATSTITVSSVNDAPVLSGATNFTTISEDQTSSSGDLVSTLIAGMVTDVDTGAVNGIAVTGLNSSTGTWQYSIDNVGSPGTELEFAL